MIPDDPTYESISLVLAQMVRRPLFKWSATGGLLWFGLRIRWRRPE